MKKVSALLTIATITMSSFTKKPANTSDLVAQHIVVSFQHGASHEFISEFPTLKEFHQLMDKNARLYGDFLPEAKKEMARAYENELLPEATETFHHILLQGKKKGVNWNAAKYVRTEIGEISEAGTATLTIVFASNGKEFKLIVEDAMNINNQWKVSQHLHLI